MNPSFLAPTVGNSVPDLGATGQVTSAINITLNPSSLGYQNIVMTVAGRSVFLPPAYANVPGQKSYTIKNSGAYPFGVRDSSGVLLTTIGPSGSAIFSLDNSINWSFTGTLLQPGLITVESNPGAGFTNTIPVPYVTLDANTSVHFLSLSTGGFSAFVADNIGKVFSTPVLISSTNPIVAAFRVSATSLIVFFGTTGTATHFAAVVTLTGSSPSYSLSAGSAATLTVASSMVAWGGENSLTQPKICQLSSTLYLASFVTGTNTAVAAISVSGAVTTIGSPVNVLVGNSVSDTNTVYPVTATTGLEIHIDTSGNMLAQVIVVAGVVCTPQAQQSIPGPNNASVAPATCQLNSTKFLILTNAATTSALMWSITVVGGTAVNINGFYTVETGITGFNNVSPTGTEGPGYSQSGATRFNPRLFTLTATTALLWYMDSGQISRCMVLTENAGVISIGTLVYRSISANTVNASQSGLFLPAGTSEFISIKQDGNATGVTYFHRLTAHKISGSAISVGQGTPLNTISSQVTSQAHVAVRMSSGDYVLGLSNTPFGPAQNLSVFRSNGDVFTIRGNIDVPALTGYTFGVAQPASNRLVLVGSTIFSGTPTLAGDSSPRIMMVELAQ